MSDIVIKGVRCSYLHWAEPKETPSGDLKFSVSLLIPEDDKENLAFIQTAIKEAIKKGVDDNKFSRAQSKSLRLPLRNGTEEHESGARGKEYDGHFFLNANSNRQPGVVDEKRQPIIDVNDFYSGCYCHAHVNFFPYNTAGNRGIGVGLNNLMKVKDGDRLDGRKSAEDAFSEFGDAPAAGPDVGDGGDGDDVF